MPTVMKLVPYFDKIEFIGMAIQNRNPGWNYLKSYNLEANDGRGSITLTADINDAMRFPDERAAMEVWKEQSKTKPLRPDGKPNRPLTAYHATFEKVES